MSPGLNLAQGLYATPIVMQLYFVALLRRVLQRDVATRRHRPFFWLNQTIKWPIVMRPSANWVRERIGTPQEVPNPNQNRTAGPRIDQAIRSAPRNRKVIDQSMRCLGHRQHRTPEPASAQDFGSDSPTANIETGLQNIQLIRVIFEPSCISTSGIHNNGNLRTQ